MFFTEYKPEKFCREYVEAKISSRQLVMFMSVVLGIKPAMDDWITNDRLAALKKACKKYGLLLEPDIGFIDVDDQSLKDSGGGGTLTTTVARGIQVRNAGAKDMIHVFISRKQESLEAISGNGWYPVVVGDRVVHKPYIDLLKFGYNLGYPTCCVDFFRHYNDWYKYSHLWEVFKNTRSRPSYLCNCFTKDLTYGYIYHIPCSYDCQATKKLAGGLRQAIRAEEPRFVELIDRHLRLPFLIFYETVMYAFEGELKNGKLSYSQVYFLGRDSRGNNYYQNILEKGDSLFVEGRTVFVSKGGKKVGKIEAQTQPNGFAPEYPFLIQFE